MQAFLASDVIYSQRVVAAIKNALDENEIGGQTIAQSRFLPTRSSWLDRRGRDEARLGAQAAPAARRRRRGTPAPGPHGHGLTRSPSASTTLDDRRGEPDQPRRRRSPSPSPSRTRARTTSRASRVRVDDHRRRAARSAPRQVVPTRPPARRRPRRIPLGAVAADRHAGDDQGHGRAVPGEEKTENNTADVPGDLHAAVSRARALAAVLSCRAVDDLTATVGIVALAAGGVALVALAIARRARRAAAPAARRQRAVLGEGGPRGPRCPRRRTRARFRALHD